MYASVLALVVRRRELKLLFGRKTLLFSGVAGICATLLAAACALVPSRQVEHLALFEFKLVGFCGFVIAAGFMCFHLNSRSVSSKIAER
jgi:membrane associated rhomboid family serine protease